MQGDYKKEVWHLDSGCSKHMTGNKSLLTDLKSCQGPVVIFGDDSTGMTEGHGVVSNGHFKFTKVAYVNGLKHNLISIS